MRLDRQGFETCGAACSFTGRSFGMEPGGCRFEKTSKSRKLHPSNRAPKKGNRPVRGRGNLVLRNNPVRRAVVRQTACHRTDVLTGIACFAQAAYVRTSSAIDSKSLNCSLDRSPGREIPPSANTILLSLMTRPIRFPRAAHA